MHLSANDIAIFTTGRETVMIGPLGAFGVQELELLLDGETEIRLLFDRLIHRFHAGPALRSHCRSWGMDISATTRREGSYFARWLTDQAMRGTIGVGMAPEPIFAFASVYDRQRRSFEDTASFAASRRGPAGRELPRPIEHKLVLALERMPELMAGEARAGFAALIERVGVGPIAGTLLAWVDASDAEAANLSLLVYDLPMVSGELLRAVDGLAGAIDDLRATRLRADLDGPAADLAAALAVLWANGVLRRFLRARQQNRGLSHGDVEASSDAKPSLPKSDFQRSGRLPARPAATAQTSSQPVVEASLQVQAVAAPAPPKDPAKEAAKTPIAQVPAGFNNRTGRRGLDDGTKRALNAFQHTQAPKISVAIEGMTPPEIEAYMQANYPDVAMTKDDLDPVPGQASGVKAVQKKWELPDGTILRVKETEPPGGLVDGYGRRDPSVAVSLTKRDEHGDPLPDKPGSAEHEAMKFDKDGKPVPKGPADADTAGLSPAERNARIDEFMNKGHRQASR